MICYNNQLHRPIAGPSHHIINSRIKINFLITIINRTWERGPLHARCLFVIFFFFAVVYFLLLLLAVFCFFFVCSGGPFSQILSHNYVTGSLVCSVVAVSSSGAVGSVWHWWWQCTGNDEAAASAKQLLQQRIAVLTMVAATSTIGAQKSHYGSIVE